MIMGNVVCNCMMVDEDEIVEVIRHKKASSLKSVGRLTGAGTGCGRCIKIIQQLITENSKNTEENMLLLK